MRKLIEWLGDFFGEVASFIFQFFAGKAVEKIISLPGLLWLLGIGGVLLWFFSRLEAGIDPAQRPKKRGEKGASGQPEPLLKMLMPFLIVVLLVILVLALNRRM